MNNAYVLVKIILIDVDFKSPKLFNCLAKSFFLFNQPIHFISKLFESFYLYKEKLLKEK